jgi:hypothetical protein
VDYFTFKIVDKKIAKRTAIQEQVIISLRSYNQVAVGTVNGLNVNAVSEDFAFHVGIALSAYTRRTDRWLIGIADCSG